MKILIYDDDLEELTQLSELLESLLSKRHIQADVQGVSTQQDFYNYLAQEEPDVIFWIFIWMMRLWGQSWPRS